MDALLCSICLTKYNSNDLIPSVLPCGHTFCSLCIKKGNNTCFNCKSAFSDTQVQKNYSFCALLEELNEVEKCVTHHRQLDRFCINCLKLMCSGCRCTHLNASNQQCPVQTIHKQVACDGCDQFPMIGNRYKCLECADFDLCEVCIGNNSHIHKKFRAFVENKTQATSNEFHKPIACDECSDPIIGNRYLCSICSNFQCCEICIADNEHKHLSFELIKPSWESSTVLNGVISDLDLQEEAVRILKLNKKVKEKKDIILRQIDEHTKELMKEIKASAEQLKKQIQTPQEMRTLHKGTLTECATIYKEGKPFEKEFQDFLERTPRIEASIGKYRMRSNSLSVPDYQIKLDLVYEMPQNLSSARIKKGSVNLAKNIFQKAAIK